MARRRRKQGTISSAKLLPRALAAQNLELMAQDQQLDVLCVQATAPPNECSQQSPERELEEGEGHIADPPNPPAMGRDTNIGALQPAEGFADVPGDRALPVRLGAELAQVREAGPHDGADDVVAPLPGGDVALDELVQTGIAERAQRALLRVIRQ